MVEYRDLVTRYISWKINNGARALFWEDSWNGFLALITSHSLGAWKHIFCAHWETVLQIIFSF